MKTLQEHLSVVPDSRRAEGKRFGFLAMLEMIVLAGMSGRFGVNPVARFMKNNEEFFIERYQLNGKVPSQTMLHNFLKALDFVSFNYALSSWMEEVLASQGKGDQWLSIDGKAIKSTLSDPHSSQQNFLSMVTIFSNNLGVAITALPNENKKSNEGTAVKALINQMQLKGVTFTLDAMHCQKKLSKPSWTVEMTI